MTARQMKDRACELSEGYEDVRDETFNDEFREFIQPYIAGITLTEDDVQGFLDSFTFPEEGDWSMDKAQSEYEGYMDSKYEQMKDERWEREQDVT